MRDDKGEVMTKAVVMGCWLEHGQLLVDLQDDKGRGIMDLPSVQRYLVWKGATAQEMAYEDRGVSEMSGESKVAGGIRRVSVRTEGDVRALVVMDDAVVYDKALSEIAAHLTPEDGPFARTKPETYWRKVVKDSPVFTKGGDTRNKKNTGGRKRRTKGKTLTAVIRAAAFIASLGAKAARDSEERASAQPARAATKAMVIEAVANSQLIPGRARAPPGGYGGLRRRQRAHHRKYVERNLEWARERAAASAPAVQARFFFVPPADVI